MSAHLILSRIEEVQVYVNYDDLKDRFGLEIATNAGTVHFILPEQLFINLTSQLNQAHTQALIDRSKRRVVDGKC